MIYLGVLNYYDIIISKLFRATVIDIDFKQLGNRFKETAFFDVSEDKVNKNFEHFMKILKKEGLINEK